MAIEEHDREDLLRDGRKMPVRGEVTLDDATMLIGFRSEGQASLYWGAERVFQFDADGKLRRIYFDGDKYAADSGTLVKLCRQSRGGRVELIREAVDERTTSELLVAIAQCIRLLAELISSQDHQWRVVGTGSADFRDRVKRWLQTPSPLQIGAAPGA